MFTSTYAIEKSAASTRHDALAAAEAHRLARSVHTSSAAPQPEPPVRRTIRIPRARRWFGIAALSR